VANHQVIFYRLDHRDTNTLCNLDESQKVYPLFLSYTHTKVEYISGVLLESPYPIELPTQTILLKNDFFEIASSWLCSFFRLKEQKPAYLEGWFLG
jgi:hypothetical protein